MGNFLCNEQTILQQQPQTETCSLLLYAPPAAKDHVEGAPLSPPLLINTRITLQYILMLPDKTLSNWFIEAGSQGNYKVRVILQSSVIDDSPSIALFVNDQHVNGNCFVDDFLELVIETETSYGLSCTWHYANLIINHMEVPFINFRSRLAFLSK
jgi:hypothetical protein